MRMLQREGHPTALGEAIAAYGRIFKSLHILILWNLICQVHSYLSWLRTVIGSRVAVAGMPISRGVAPLGVRTSTSRSKS